MDHAKKNPSEKSIVWLVLAVLIATGSFLRLWNLGRTSLWVDETNALFAAKSWIENGTLTFPSGFTYTRAPLYTYMTGLFFKAFGITETATRLTAALFGILCIGMVFVLAKKMFNTRVGLLAAFFVVFSPFEVGWSRTAKMYTMMQFLTLAAMYAFVRGFEAENKTILKDRHPSAVGRICAAWEISPGWLAISGTLFLYASIYVHALTVLALWGIFLYCITMAGIRIFHNRISGRFINKYAIVSVLGVCTALAGWILAPSLRQKLVHFVLYTPAWAEGGSSAQNRQFLFEFLISPERFPLAAFFFVGSLLTLTRQAKLGWLAWCVFITAFLSLSFVFTHRVPTYLFFVYPLFLATAAFGFVSFVEQELVFLKGKMRTAKPWSRIGFAAAAFSVFLISPWLRITLHIPFFQDGVTNMAVTPEEWREASKKVLDRKRVDDLVVTSLPQVALYYGLKSDYCLNWADLALTRVEEILTKDGRLADIYAGVPCIQGLEEFKQLVQTHPRGWLAVSQFHLDNDNYIPEPVREFILNHFSTPGKTANGTVLVFSWDT